MADIVSELAARCGISTDTAQKGLGVVLGLLKHLLPAESFSEVRTAVPGADSMMARAAETGEPDSGGLAGTLKAALSNLFGGGGTDALISKLGALGMSADQIQEFIPIVLAVLKGRLPENVMNQISSLLPSPQEAAH